MATLLVGYDLNKPGQDYSRLIEFLKGTGNWWHHLESTWIIKADITAESLRDAIRHYVDGSDEVLVVDVTAGSAAWSGFNQQGSAWLRTNL